jgi:DNA-binding MurR/RpiR family transcriptional regulator
VARFLAANEGAVAFTPATVVRLAQALGFQGYPDLQRHLRASYPAASTRPGQESDGTGLFPQDALQSPPAARQAGCDGANG